MTAERPVPIEEAAAALPGPWQPGDLVRVNEAVVRIARLESKFPGTLTRKTN